MEYQRERIEERKRKEQLFGVRYWRRFK
jgi:hypothetical protein